MSPGAYPLTVYQTALSGRRLASNAVLGHFLPRLDGAAHGALTPQAGGKFSGQLTLSGACLGGPDAAVFVQLHWETAAAVVALESRSPLHGRYAVAFDATFCLLSAFCKTGLCVAYSSSGGPCASNNLECKELLQCSPNATLSGVDWYASEP